MADADVVGRGSLDGRAPYTEIYLQVADGIVKKATFTTFGCAVSIACASIATELLAGKPLSECARISDFDVCDALEDVPTEKRFCASIVVQAIRDAVSQAQERESLE
jgi:NifU-like protein